MSDYGDMARRVSKLRDNLEDEHERATKESMGDLRSQVRINLQRNDSDARGVLYQDIDDGDATSYPQMVARSVTLPWFAIYLEHGTGQLGGTDTVQGHKQFKAPDPGPPIEPIRTWVTAKQIQSSYYDDPDDLARAIQSQIAAIGTFPHPFYRPAWHGPRGYQNVIDANKRAMRRALRRM